MKTKSLSLWKFNRITGLWNHQRNVTPETSGQWLFIFGSQEPKEFFKVSKHKPKKAPWEK